LLHDGMLTTYSPLNTLTLDLADKVVNSAGSYVLQGFVGGKALSNFAISGSTLNLNLASDLGIAPFASTAFDYDVWIYAAGTGQLVGRALGHVNVGAALTATPAAPGTYRPRAA